jgi:hypothetical protein
MLSGLIPTRVPLNDLPVVVTTATVFSARDVISAKYFLCATDNFIPLRLTKLHSKYLSVINITKNLNPANEGFLQKLTFSSSKIAYKYATKRHSYCSYPKAMPNPRRSTQKMKRYS